MSTSILSCAVTALFSRYRNGENRVTATMMAVFERLNFSLVERILAGALGDGERSLLSFQNQVSKGGEGVPDAQISGSFVYLFETKVEQAAVTKDQIERHLKRLATATGTNRRLIVLTPDSDEPAVVKSLREKHKDPSPLKWTSFDDIADAIETILDPIGTVDDVLVPVRPTEREVFLLQELLAFFLQEGLIRQNKGERVLIVPAGTALADYEAYGAYLCQPNRSFQPSRYLAFYSGNKIHPWVPKILASIDEVTLTQDGIAQISSADGGGIAVPDLSPNLVHAWLMGLLRGIETTEPGRIGNQNKVLFLTPKKDLAPDEKLAQPIENDQRSESGRRAAFVQNQRYTTMPNLRAARTTSDLGKAPSAA